MLFVKLLIEVNSFHYENRFIYKVLEISNTFHNEINVKVNYT